MPRTPQPIRDAREAACLSRHLADPDPHVQYAKDADLSAINTSISTLSASLASALAAIAVIPGTVTPTAGVSLSDPNVWTAMQTIDLGTTGAGLLPVAMDGTCLRLGNLNGKTNRIMGIGFGFPPDVYALDLAGFHSQGDRGVPGNAAGGFVSLSAFGYRNGLWDYSAAAVFRIDSDGGWSSTNKGIAYRWDGTSNGSTSRAQWMELSRGSLCVGDSPILGNGKLQLVSGTTKANGIAFGTDTFLYRGSGLNLEQTWNNGATLFNGLKMTITDTASNVGSNLIGLYVGASPKFRVGKDGTIIGVNEFLMDGTSLTVGTLRFQDPAGAFVYDGDNTVGLTICAGGAKLGFYDTTPTTQPSAIAAAATTAATNVAPYGYTTAAQADEIVTKLNLALAALRTLGLIAP